MKRREFLKLSFGTVAVTALPVHARAEAGVNEIRVGYQKNGVLVIARQQSILEKHFKPQGIDVSHEVREANRRIRSCIFTVTIDFHRTSTTMHL